MQQPGPGAGTDVKLTGEGLNFSMGCNSLNSRPCRTMDSGLTIFPGAREQREPWRERRDSLPQISRCDAVTQKCAATWWVSMKRPPCGNAAASTLDSSSSRVHFVLVILLYSFFCILPWTHSAPILPATDIGRVANVVDYVMFCDVIFHIANYCGLSFV